MKSKELAEKTNRGGSRPGAGRPKLGLRKRRALNVLLPPAALAWLRRRARARKITASRVVSDLVEAAAGGDSSTARVKD